LNSGGACLVVTGLGGTGALIGVILALGDAAYEVYDIALPTSKHFDNQL
jgi:hypothetical protein